MSEQSTELQSRREVSLVEILDRALGAGVVITGDITLSLADIDLVYLGLRLVVGSVPSVRGEGDAGEQLEGEALALGSASEGGS